MTSFKITPPVLWLAGLGLVSGLLSSFLPNVVEHIKLLGTPVYPGVLFGLVIAFGLHRWGKAPLWAAVLAIVITIIAWAAAVRGFELVTNKASSHIYLGALVAGAVGAAGTMMAGAVSLPALRRAPDWLLIIGVGAVAGLLVVPDLEGSGDRSFLLLFMIWQAAIAGCIGFALTRR